MHLSPYVAAAHSGGLPPDRRIGATNEAYAIAKIAGLKLAQAYRRQYNFSAISLMRYLES